MAFAYTKLMQAMVAAGVVTPTDPYFNLVTLLLPGNGTNGAQNNTFLDSSSNNFTITRNGNTTQGTFSPFSQTGWSNYFDGNGDYLSLTGGVTDNGTGDLTLEFWSYYTGSYSAEAVAFDSRVSPFTNGFAITVAATSGYWTMNFTSQDILTSTAAAKNAWQHVALTRSGNTFRLFVDGVLRGTLTSANNLTNNTNRIGTSYNNGSPFPGYLSNLRAIKGSIPTDYQTSSTTVGTSVFTPPTAPLTAVSGTSLLTCQANRFLDASTNAFTITPTGDTSVQAFSPFAPTAAYSAATNGGSGYFDGTGDYLTIARNTAFIPTTGDFTFEAWVYPLNTNAAIIAGLQETGTGADWNFFIASDSTIGLFAGNGSGQLNSTQTVKTNQWNHCVASRSGSTLYIGCNGALTSGTFTNSLDNGQSYPLSIGADQNGDENNLTGYMSGLRLIKGSAQYTSTTYTVPTAPPTAITNTAVLLNYTNAGITDATAKNDLETVGNASISTTQSKFGGSSMYFDGTGDALNFRSNDILAFGTGDWTIEFWVYHASISGQQTYVGDTPGNSNGPYVYKDASNKIGLYYSTQILTATNAISATTWYHVAIARASGTVRLFINGTQEASASDTTNLSVPVQWIGADGTSNYLNGYIDDLRITKGYARYTANFTVTTTTFPLQ